MLLFPDMLPLMKPSSTSDAPAAILPFHSICGKLPGVGTLNESSTNGPGVAGFGRGLRQGSNREGTGCFFEDRHAGRTVAVVDFQNAASLLGESRSGARDGGEQRAGHCECA